MSYTCKVTANVVSALPTVERRQVGEQFHADR